MIKGVRKLLSLNAVKTISDKIKSEVVLESKIFIDGDIGCGKTTLAYAIAGELSKNVTYVDCTTIKSEDLEYIIESIRSKFSFISTGKKVYIFDEVHRLSKLIASRLLPVVEELNGSVLIFISSISFKTLRYQYGEEFAALMSRLNYKIEMTLSPETISSILIEEGWDENSSKERSKLCGNDLRSALWSNELSLNDLNPTIRNYIVDFDNQAIKFCYGCKDSEMVLSVVQLSMVPNPVLRAFGFDAIVKLSKRKK